MKLATVLYAFTAIMPGEISLQKGKTVIVTEEIDKFWLKGFICGINEDGTFPRSNISFCDLTSAEDQTVFVAIHEYNSLEPGDLKLQPGDIVTGFNRIDESWWQGELYAKTGIFPVAFTVEVESVKKKCVFGKQVVAIQNLTAQLPEELSLRIGMTLTVTGEPMDGWYSGECQGKSGVFPCQFVKIINDGDIVEAEPDRHYVQMNSEVGCESVVDSRYKNLTSLTETLAEQYDGALSRSFTNELGTEHVTGRYENLSSTLENVNNRDPQSMYCNIGALDPLAASDKNHNHTELNDFSGNFGQFSQVAVTHSNSRQVHESDAYDLFQDEYFRVNAPYFASGNERSTIGSSNRNNVTADVDTPPMLAVVLYDFVPECQNELALLAGQEVAVLRESGDGWAEGVLDGKRGIFPSTYVERVSNLPDSCRSATSSRETEYNLHCDLDKPELIPQVELSKESEIPRFSTSFSSAKPLSYKPPRPATWQIVVPADDYLKAPSKFMSRNQDPDISDVESLKPSLPSTVVEERSLSWGPNRRSLDASRILPPVPPRSFERQTSAPTFSVTKPLSGALISESLTLSEFEEIKSFESASGAGGKPLITRPAPAPPEMKKENPPIRPAPPVPHPTAPTLPAAQAVAFASPCPQEGDLVIKVRKQREGAVDELLTTEREYCRDLKLAVKVFEVESPDRFVQLGVNMPALFGNIVDVICLSIRFLDKLEYYNRLQMQDLSFLSVCFVSLENDFQSVYTTYCTNHDSVQALLEEYESIPDVQIEFHKRIQILKDQIHCFNVGSVLIKPVQRIMKYQLILGEILRNTDKDSTDKGDLSKACKAMMRVVSAINEAKRRKEVVKKYLDESESVIARKLSKVSLHSVSKKSTRMAARVSLTFGKGNQHNDESLKEAVKRFDSLLSSTTSFRNEVLHAHQLLFQVVDQQLKTSELIASYYEEKSQLRIVDDFRTCQRVMKSQGWALFDAGVQKSVRDPLAQLIQLCSGPTKLLQKRSDKFLDFTSATHKLERNKDPMKQRGLQDEFNMTRGNFEALNAQLTEELPIFVTHGCDVYSSCVQSWFVQRRGFLGRSSKQLFSVLEGIPSEGVVEHFLVEHALAVAKIKELSCISKNLGLEAAPSPLLKKKENPSSKADVYALLRLKYHPDNICITMCQHVAKEPLDISVGSDVVVGVIKASDPMGRPDRWFVDTGDAQGFLPHTVLKHFQLPSATLVQPALVNLAPTYEDLQREILLMTDEQSCRYYALPPDGGDRYDEPPGDLEEQPSLSTNTDEAGVELLLALYDFEARNEKELSIRDGELLKVVSKEDMSGNLDWFLVENTEGSRGYVPSSYLRNLGQSCT